MSRLKIPNQKKAYSAHAQRLGRYMLQVIGIYDKMVSALSQKVLDVGYDGSVELLFKDYPELGEAVEKAQNDFVSSMGNLIISNTSEEWRESNLVQDKLAEKVWDYYEASHSDKKYKHFFQTNSDALQAFQSRRYNGMNLSQRLWQQSESAKTELEDCIATAIQKGMSAITLSKRVSKYLQDFPSMKADYSEKFGHASKAKNCQYASIRLARSEINMAYRSAEQLRWKQMDFILGYEIKLSKSHPVHDICDDLKGKYPKDFKFTGWHPNCMCYTIPIIASEDEYWSGKPLKYVDSVPAEFKDWAVNNQSRIAQAEKRGTLPYFIKDNINVVKNVIKEEAAKQAPLQPFVMTDDIMDKLVKRGFNDLGAKAYNESMLAGFDLDSFDKLMDSIGDKYSVYWKEKRIDSYGGKNVSLVYHGKSDFGDFDLSRDFLFEDGKKKVYHNIFLIPQELQGHGLSKTIFRELFKNYERMGLDIVETFANINVGGYCWGRYGFSANTSEIRRIVKGRLNVGAITQEQYDEVSAILQKAGEEIPMNRLANLSYGKKMLLGKSVKWRGWIDLHNKTQMDYLHDYLRPKK